MTQKAKIFLLLHHWEQTVQMPITQLPVSENPLPQEREAYLLVEIYSETNFKHVELEGVDPTLPRTLHNFHMMFTTFLERLCHVPHPLHSMWGTHVLQQEGHFQAEGLPRLETNEINKSWRVAQPFQIPPCETGFHNGMINGLSYPRETLAESYKGTRWAFPSETLSSTPHIRVHNQLSSNHLLIWTGSYLGTLTLSFTMAKSSTHLSNVIEIMHLTTTITLFSTKTQSTKTYVTHRGCWKQQKLKMSLTSYMPYLQETLVDECIEELERKEKRSEDFRNSLDFLKNSPFHSLFSFPGQSPDCYAWDIGSFDNFLLLNGDTPFFILPYCSHNDRDICV